MTTNKEVNIAGRTLERLLRSTSLFRQMNDFDLEDINPRAVDVCHTIRRSDYGGKIPNILRLIHHYTDASPDMPICSVIEAWGKLIGAPSCLIQQWQSGYEGSDISLHVKLSFKLSAVKNFNLAA